MHSFITYIALTISLALSAVPAHAQTVIRVDHTDLALIVSNDEDGFRSCGVRAMVLAGEGKHGWIYEFTVGVYPDLLEGLSIAVKYNPMDVVSRSKLTAVRPGPTAFWIAAPDRGTRVTLGKLIPDKPGFIAGSTELMPSLEMVTNIATGKQIQFALRYKNEQADRIVSFAKTMSDADLRTLLACTKGIEGRMMKALDAQQSPRVK